MNFALVILAYLLFTLQLVLIIVYLTFGRKRPPFTFDIGVALPRRLVVLTALPKSTELVSLQLLLAVCLPCLLVVFGPCSSYRQLTILSKQSATVRAPLLPQLTRGRILDRNGVEIVTNRPKSTVVARADVAKVH